VPSFPPVSQPFFTSFLQVPCFRASTVPLRGVRSLSPTMLCLHQNSEKSSASWFSGGCLTNWLRTCVVGEGRLLRLIVILPTPRLCPERKSEKGPPTPLTPSSSRLTKRRSPCYYFPQPLHHVPTLCVHGHFPFLFCAHFGGTCRGPCRNLLLSFIAEIAMLWSIPNLSFASTFRATAQSFGLLCDLGPFRLVPFLRISIS